MKLGELKANIRKTKGSPLLSIALTPGAVGTVALLKSPLLEALDAMYPGGKAVETGLVFEIVGDNAMIRPEASDEPYGIVTAAGPLLEIMEAPAKDVGGANLLDLDDGAPIPSPGLLDLDDTPPAVAASPMLLDL